MPRIQKLPPAVVNRIAAGEVVERPASVVKELLENALDAGPTRIDVALEQGGVALVRVSDDGCGIPPDDLPLAIAQHATSKLRVAEDLERIGTLGFRGEALASIGEVSRLVIRSRTADAAGASITVDGGRMGEVVPEGCGVGTTVEVHQLFGNVPARRAFLRAAHTEWSHSSEAFVRTALAHPGVAFTLTHNAATSRGRRVHDLPATDSWRRRISDLYGETLGSRLLEVEAADDDIAVSGFVGRPEDDMAGTRLQHLFVAGRPFRDRSILHAVQEAYRGMLLSGRQPIVFLQFTVPPDAVDVNVHPAKMEVRFREPSRLYRLVLAALRTRFLADDMKARLKPPIAAAESASTSSRLWADEPVVAQTPPAWRPEPEFVPFPSRPSTSGSPPPAGWTGGRDAVPAWEQAAPSAAADERAVQMHNRYLIVEAGDGIEVIDQHALHERVLYERLKAAVERGGLDVQRLLVPERIDLSPAELELVQEHAATLEQAGMQVEPFGGTTVIVTSKPVLAGNAPAAAIVREALDRLAAVAAAPGRTASLLVDEVLHGLACKAAIKAGDPLSQAEVDALVRDRRLVRESHHCPHGRPTSLTLSRQELDRQFRRT
ncbi:MAG: DNA mismatch repair endonuclease MutL [Pirellulales bacterium]